MFWFGHNNKTETQSCLLKIDKKINLNKITKRYIYFNVSFFTSSRAQK